MTVRMKDELKKTVENQENAEREQLHLKIEELQKKDMDLRDCILAKDKRITKIEEHLRLIKLSVLGIWYTFWISGSILLVVHSWVYVATNSKWGLIDFLSLASNESKTIPVVFSDGPNTVFSFIMILFVSLVCSGWVGFFYLRGDL